MERNDFIKRIAVDTANEKDVIEKVMRHSINELIKHSKECTSLEFTGWGTFYLNERRIPYYIKKWEAKIGKMERHVETMSQPKSIEKLRERIENSKKALEKTKKKYGME